jgi:hypothetical protein
VPRHRRDASDIAVDVSVPITPIFFLDPKCLDHHLRDLPPRLLLLTSDQPAVAHGERLEQAALHVVAPRSPSTSSTRQGITFSPTPLPRGRRVIPTFPRQ